jgi:hypothetical protein
MELKTPRLTVPIEVYRRRALDKFCALRDPSETRMMRRMIQDRLAQDGVAGLACSASRKA